MRFLNFFLSILGFCTILLSGVLLLALSLNLVTPEILHAQMAWIETAPQTRLLLGAIGGTLLVLTVALLQTLMQSLRRQKTIAFHNPDGEVTVSLETINDFVKKIGQELNGVKELKPSVTAGRSGILVTVQAVLWSDSQIPEITEGLQSIIRNHIHELLGVEEQITVRVHVGKIVQRTGQKEAVEERVV